MNRLLLLCLITVLFSCNKESNEFKVLLKKFPIINDTLIIENHEVLKAFQGKKLDQKIVLKYFSIENPSDPTIIELTYFYPLFRMNFSDGDSGCIGYVTRRNNDSINYVIHIANYKHKRFLSFAEFKTGSINNKSELNKIIVTKDKVINVGKDTLDTNFGFTQFRTLDEVLGK